MKTRDIFRVCESKLSFKYPSFIKSGSEVQAALRSVSRVFKTPRRKIHAFDSHTAELFKILIEIDKKQECNIKRGYIDIEYFKALGYQIQTQVSVIPWVSVSKAVVVNDISKLKRIE